MPLDLLALRLWHRRMAVALMAAMLCAAGAAAILAWPRSYVAAAILAPAETSAIATSQILSPAPLLGGGLLDSRPSGNFAVYLATLRSTEAAAMLLRETALADSLAAQRRAGPLGGVRTALGLDRAITRDDAAAWLRHNLSVTPAQQTVTWTLEVPHRDRDLALDILRHLHDFAETRIRHDLRATVDRRLGLLGERLARESDVYQRQALYDLVAQQQRFALVLAADEAVAGRLVSPPAVGIEPSLPNRPLLLMLLAPTSLLAALALTALRIRAGTAPQRGLRAGYAE